MMLTHHEYKYLSLKDRILCLPLIAVNLLLLQSISWALEVICKFEAFTTVKSVRVLTMLCDICAF